MSSAYGNPQPCATVTLERRALVGRMSVARTLIRIYRGNGESGRADVWQRIADELLGHLSELESRVGSAAMEGVTATAPAVEPTPGPDQR